MRQKAKKSLKLVTLVALALGVAYSVFKAPEWHGAWIRDKVGSKTVMLTDKTGRAGGTGFLLEMPSGDVLTMTNAHVCEIEALAQSPIYAHYKNRRIKMRIEESYEKADLCLLSGIKTKDGLQVASEVEIGQEVGIVGHPALQPLTLTRGQLVGYEEVMVLVNEGPCKEDVGMYRTIADPWYGTFCVEQFNAGLTTVVILGGSSGSAVVDFFGDVVGVAFASGGPQMNNWAIIVKLEHLKDFIAGH